MYFDCDTTIGRSYGTKNLGGYHISPQQLIAAMDQAGVEQAVVYHTLSREYAPAVGNARLTEELAGLERRLVGCWVLLPHHTGEIAPPRELVRDMLRNNVRMARMFPNFHPNSHRFELAEWCVGELLSALEEVRMPLIIDFALFRRDQPPFRDIYDICRNHPGLPVVLVGVQARNNRSLFPLLKQFKQLHIQTAGYYVHRGIENFVSAFGSEQLLFGSGYPILGMGAAVFHLERSLIPQQDKRQIAGGNLNRLLNQVKREAEKQ